MAISNAHRRLVAAASVLVPHNRREDWIREWEAELHHRADRIGGIRAHNPAVRRSLTAQALGAFVDAGFMRVRSWHEGLLLDLRHSLRGFRREPGFVAFVLLLMALGIGVNAALFSVVDAVLLEPLPYPEPERLVRVWETRVSDPAARESPSPGNFQHWRRNGKAFESLASWYASSVTLSDAGGAATYDSAQVSNDFFRVFGVAPEVGRTFTDDEVDRAVYDNTNTHRGEGPVVVLSHHVWVQRYGADPAVVGQRVQLGRKSWQVIGIMPAGFDMPDDEVDLWVPWSFAHDRPRDQRYTQVAGRLADGVGVDAAAARMQLLAAEMAQAFPATNEGWSATVEPLVDHEIGPVRGSLWTLSAAVGCLLGIACLNVAGLQVVRAMARRREVAIRVALGASRARLVRQFLIEGLALATAGGILGVALASGLVDLLQALDLSALPRIDEARIDGRVIGFAAVLTGVTGLLFSLLPAIGGIRGQPVAAMQASSRGTTASRGSRRLRSALVVTEVALAVTLLVGAGLLFRSFTRLTGVDLGYSVDNVLVLPIFLDGDEYGRDGTSSAMQYYIDLVDRLEAIPGVESAGGATALPLSKLGPDFFRPVWRAGHERDGADAPQADIRMATPRYFETLGIPLVAGRAFEPSDGRESERVIVVNERLAQRHWPGESPVGRELVIDYASAGTHPYRVVGIVGDVRFHGPRREPRDELYIPHAQRSYLIMNVAVRTSGPPEPLIDGIRRAVLEVDASQPVHSIVPLRELMGETVVRDRLSATLLVAFAAIALLLSGAGLYGVMAYQVRRRSQEIGIRMALGARASEIQRQVLAGGVRLVGLGLVVGLAAAVFLSRWIATQLFEVEPTDPATLGTVVVVLVATAILASWIPARRAARCDPIRVLRED